MEKEIWEDGAEWQGHQHGNHEDAVGGKIMKVLYFAEIKEVLDKSSEDIDLSYDITVDEFVSDLFERYPSINSKKFQIAINEEFVKGDDIVKP